MLKIYDEIETPNEGAMFMMYDEPESRNWGGGGGACLRHMMVNRQH